MNVAKLRTLTFEKVNFFKSRERYFFKMLRALNCESVYDLNLTKVKPLMKSFTS